MLGGVDTALRLEEVLMRLVVLSFVLAACTNTAPPPAPTQTVCPVPDPNTLTWDNFGQQFMASYCTACHSSTLARSQRNGAPLYHDFDSLRGVLQIPDHIDEYAGSGPAAHNSVMPLSRCPSTPGGPLDRDCPIPSDAERTNLSMWIACEVLRSH
jgi:cytochrome c1